MTASADINRKSGQVTVKLGDRTYDIVIGAGLLASAPQHLMQALPGTRFAIVADWALSAYAHDLERRLQEHDLLLGEICFVPSGEGSKCFSELERVCNALLDLGIERKHAVIALGGGVIGDLAGLAAVAREARRPARAGADNASRASRLVRGRQDRHRHAPWQEPYRNLPSAVARADRSCDARIPA